MFVANIGNLFNFSGATFLFNTGAKFTYNQWNSQSLCIFSSLANLLVMPVVALLAVWKQRLAVGTRSRQITAVSVLVKHVRSRPYLTSWRHFEAHGESVAVLVIGEFAVEIGFKPHLSWLWLCLQFLVNVRVKGCQMFDVHDSGDVQRRILHIIPRIWLIYWLKPSNVWITGKLVGKEVPKL